MGHQIYKDLLEKNDFFFFFSSSGIAKCCVSEKISLGKGGIQLFSVSVIKVTKEENKSTE